MRVNGLRHWIGAGLGALGLVAAVLLVSTVSTGPGDQLLMPMDQTASSEQAGSDTTPDQLASAPVGVGQSEATPESAADDASSRILRVKIEEPSNGTSNSATANVAPKPVAGSDQQASDDGRQTTSTMAAPEESTASTQPTTESTAGQTSTTAPTTTESAPTTGQPTTTAQSTTTEPGSDDEDDTSLEQQVIRLTNDARRQAGCPDLVPNGKLRQAAYLHSKDMNDKDYFSHTGKDGSSPADRISRQGYGFRGWAENIAWGYRTPEAVVEGWMNSPGHRANILNCGLTEIGVGYHNDYWTQNFGTPR